jgi:hypothetical protein
MKVHAFGAVRLTGRGGKGPFDFAQLHITASVNVRQSENITVRGSGYEPRTLDISLDDFHKFEKLHFPPQGLVLELETKTEPNPRGQGFVTYITGYKPVSSTDQPKAG